MTADGVNLTNDKIVQYDTDRFRYFVGVRLEPEERRGAAGESGASFVQTN
jgi:hypothetical protein